MADKPDFRAALRDAIAAPSGEEATTGAAETTEDTATTAEVTETGSATSPEAGEGEQTAAAETSTTEASSEGETGAPAAATEDVPTEYFGIDLSALSAEERAGIIAGFTDRDKHIQQLLREKAEAKKADASPETPAAPAAPAAEEEASDADILAALGLDPENNPDDVIVAKTAVPLARMVLEMRAEVNGVKAKSLEAETATLWETSLTSLEGQYGKLPEGISHEDVMREAAKAGIAEPIDAYWRIMGPARAGVLEAVKARREEATKKLKGQQPAPVKPRSDAPTQPGPLEATTVKAATREAMKRVLAEKGWSFDGE